MVNVRLVSLDAIVHSCDIKRVSAYDAFLRLHGHASDLLPEVLIVVAEEMVGQFEAAIASIRAYWGAKRAAKIEADSKLVPAGEPDARD